MSEGELSEWLVADGATVTEGDPLFALESEKSTNEIEASSIAFTNPSILETR